MSNISKEQTLVGKGQSLSFAKLPEPIIGSYLHYGDNMPPSFVLSPDLQNDHEELATAYNLLRTAHHDHHNDHPHAVYLFNDFSQLKKPLAPE